MGGFRLKLKQLGSAVFSQRGEGSLISDNSLLPSPQPPCAPTHSNKLILNPGKHISNLKNVIYAHPLHELEYEPNLLLGLQPNSGVAAYYFNF